MQLRSGCGIYPQVENNESTSMSDDKKKTKEDRNFIAFKEAYEVDYAVNQLKKQFPEETKAEIKKALFNAARKVQPSEGREKVMRLTRKELK